MIKFTEKQVILLHEQIIKETGGETGLRDASLLESALLSPFQSFNDKDLFPSIQAKAARLGYGITKNHPFIDGNKRIGAHLMLLFLYFNNVELSYTQKELSEIILMIASSEKNYEDLLDWIIEHQIWYKYIGFELLLREIVCIGSLFLCLCI